MTQTASDALVLPVAPRPSIPVLGGHSFAVRRVYCIGRNYADHAREMGHDPDREPPFFFQKNPENLDASGSLPYPPHTSNLNHEVELLVALGKGGRNIPLKHAMSHIWGYAVSLDMTLRDLQERLKHSRRPWELAKAFERSAPVGLLAPADGRDMMRGGISMHVNGTLRQIGDLAQMIWKIPEQIAILSQHYALDAGDVILTGTPAGVGPVVRGDVMEARIDGLPDLTVRVT